jgi:hypothetical protein
VGPSVWASSIEVTLLLKENHSNRVFFPMYLPVFPNGRYIDCFSLTYATNNGEILKLYYKYIKKRKNIKEHSK